MSSSSVNTKVTRWWSNKRVLKLKIISAKAQVGLDIGLLLSKLDTKAWMPWGIPTQESVYVFFTTEIFSLQKNIH